MIKPILMTMIAVVKSEGGKNVIAAATFEQKTPWIKTALDAPDPYKWHAPSTIYTFDLVDESGNIFGWRPDWQHENHQD